MTFVLHFEILKDLYFSPLDWLFMLFFIFVSGGICDAKWTILKYCPCNFRSLTPGDSSMQQLHALSDSQISHKNESFLHTI